MTQKAVSVRLAYPTGAHLRSVLAKTCPAAQEGSRCCSVHYEVSHKHTSSAPRRASRSVYLSIAQLGAGAQVQCLSRLNAVRFGPHCCRPDPKDRLLPHQWSWLTDAVIANWTHPLRHPLPSWTRFDPHCFLAPGPRDGKGLGTTQNLAHSRTELSALLSRWPAYRDAVVTQRPTQFTNRDWLVAAAGRLAVVYDDEPKAGSPGLYVSAPRHTS